MRTHDIEQFIALESQVWQALVEGDGAADERLLSEDFLGVYTVGFADRAAHVAEVGKGPSVTDYALSDARLMVLTDDIVLLAYRCTLTRPGASDPESVLISSIWEERDGAWVNTFSQDTPAEES